jgi:chromosome segregation ATPase
MMEQREEAYKAAIREYKSVIGEAITLVKQKEGTVDTLTKDIEQLELLKSNALAKAESVETQLQQQGQTQEAIERNPDYMKSIAGYNDFSSTLNKKNARISELKADIERTQDDVDRYKLQLTALSRELDAEIEQKERTDTLAAIDKREQHLHNLLQRLYSTLSKGKGGGSRKA